MPDFWSHLIAADMILKRLEHHLTKDSKLLYEHYRLGAQGPDFLYYLGYTSLKQKTKRLSAVGNCLHVENLSPFFLDIVDDYKTSTSPEFKAYVEGFLSHYFVDVACHPLICKWGPDSKSHKKVEMSLDRWLIEKLTQQPIHKQKIKNLAPSPENIHPHVIATWQSWLKPFQVELNLPCKIQRDFQLIQWMILKQIPGKLPLRDWISNKIHYDLSLLCYEDLDSLIKINDHDLALYQEKFNEGIESTVRAIKDLQEISCPKEWVKKHILYDFLGGRR